MKKLYFIFLILPFWGLSSTYAQSVKLIDQNFDTGAVTFTVDVGAATPTWVLVEYTTDPSPTSAIMSRATFTNETVIPGDAGTLAAEGQGFLLTSSATITAKLSGVNDSRFSWCGYAFNAPPNAKLNPDGSYTLRGTPPFIVNGETLADDVTTFVPGTCITSITDFTYNPAGNPSLPVVTVSASETEVCAGTEVTFTATASGGTTTAMTYTWDVAGSTPSFSTNTYSLILSAVGKATYTVVVTNVNGCTSTASGTVTVNAVPAVTAVSSSTICYNTAATLTANATGATTPATYTWEINGESATTNTNTYTIPARTAPITYTVQITNATGCTSTVSDAGTITWYDEFIPGAITKSAETICSGEVVTTIATPASGGNESQITYKWQHNGVDIVSADALTYTPSGSYNTDAGAHTFTHWAKDGKCQTDWRQSAGSYVLTVNPRPVTPTNASSVSICAGNTATFSASVATGAIIDWYDALTGGNMVSPNTWSYTPGSPLTVTTTYYAEASNTTTGCVSIPRLTVTTTVEALPVILVDGMPGSACVGDELNVQASGARAGSSYCFSSYVDGIGNSDCEYRESNTYSVTVPPTGTTTIRVRAMTPAGCVDSVLVHVPDMSSPDCINSAGTILSNSATAILGPYPPRTAAKKPTSVAPAVNQNATYEWRRTGTSSAILANSNTETYIITEYDDALYTAGTYYYNRYIRDGSPENSVGLRADGTYTLVVVAPPHSAAGTQTWCATNCSIIWTAAVQNSTINHTKRSPASGYYYVEEYAANRTTTLCPTPWVYSANNECYFASLDLNWIGTAHWEYPSENNFRGQGWVKGPIVFTPRCWSGQGCYDCRVTPTNTNFHHVPSMSYWQYDQVQVRCVARYNY
jgi:hypothetical protein